MQRCPKCGYREGTEWPWILCIAAVSVLYMAFILAIDRELRDVLNVRWVGLVAYLLFGAAMTWRGFREKRYHKEYLALHPPATERIKSHIKSTPAGGQ
jgi:hypothetical protein